MLLPRHLPSALQAALVSTPTDSSARIPLPAGYPRAFTRLWEEHLFTAFESGGVRISSNIRGEPDNLEELLADEALTTALFGAKFFPFGRPSQGSWDRICFDLRKKAVVNDAPTVRMDHESILSFGRIPRPIPIAASFVQLLAP